MKRNNDKIQLWVRDTDNGITYQDCSLRSKQEIICRNNYLVNNGLDTFIIRPESTLDNKEFHVWKTIN